MVAAVRPAAKYWWQKKLYAVRDSKGKFKDIQTYERAHGQDIKRTSKAEPKKKK